jgi:peptidoglycan-associated lipoprotein
MRLKLIGIVGAVLLLSACDTPSQNSAASGGMGGAAGGAGAYGTGPGTGVDSAGLNGDRNGGKAVPGSQQDLAQNVGDRVFFGYDQYELSSEARAVLDRQAQWLRQYANVTVTIEGHADERGTREYNLALGDRRASSVKKYLMARGIPEIRIATVSFGKERPAITGSGESSWAQNRRGVTMIN